MGEKVRRFADGSTLEYDYGRFDKWCVYLNRPNGECYAPRDEQYFTELYQFAKKYDANQLYKDFVQIYNSTGKELDESVFNLIDDLCEKYNEDAINIAIVFSIIYMGMISEENKKGTKLGKRIKRLGVHQVLVEKLDCKSAARYSLGMKWNDIDRICKEKGF